MPDLFVCLCERGRKCCWKQRKQRIFSERETKYILLLPTSRGSFQKHPPGLVCNSNLFKVTSFSDRLLQRYEPEFGKVCCVAHSICPFNGHSSMCLYRVFVFGEYEGRRQITISQLIHDLPISHQSYCKGTFHLRFSGIRPLRGYPPPLNGKSV